jgi:uncharacterized protein (UPF0333 family)
MRVKEGQSVIEYVLLVAIVILALIFGATFGQGKFSFNDHFKAASGGYFRGGGTPPDSK